MPKMAEVDYCPFLGFSPPRTAFHEKVDRYESLRPLSVGAACRDHSEWREPPVAASRSYKGARADFADGTRMSTPVSFKALIDALKAFARHRPARGAAPWCSNWCSTSATQRSACQALEGARQARPLRALQCRSETPVCAVCASSRRDASLLCVVETPAPDHAEQSGAFSGLYFVLLGRSSPLDGVGPGQIHLEKLVQRATEGTVKEVILATNFTNEGEVTAHVITELLEGQGVKVSRSRAASRSGRSWSMWMRRRWRRRFGRGGEPQQEEHE